MNTITIEDIKAILRTAKVEIKDTKLDITYRKQLLALSRVLIATRSENDYSKLKDHMAMNSLATEFNDLDVISGRQIGLPKVNLSNIKIPKIEIPSMDSVIDKKKFKFPNIKLPKFKISKNAFLAGITLTVATSAILAATVFTTPGNDTDSNIFEPPKFGVVDYSKDPDRIKKAYSIDATLGDLDAELERIKKLTPKKTVDVNTHMGNLRSARSWSKDYVDYDLLDCDNAEGYAMGLSCSLVSDDVKDNINSAKYDRDATVMGREVTDVAISAEVKSLLDKNLRASVVDELRELSGGIINDRFTVYRATELTTTQRNSLLSFQYMVLETASQPKYVTDKQFNELGVTYLATIIAAGCVPDDGKNSAYNRMCKVDRNVIRNLMQIVIAVDDNNYGLLTGSQSEVARLFKFANDSI